MSARMAYLATVDSPDNSCSRSRRTYLVVSARKSGESFNAWIFAPLSLAQPARPRARLRESAEARSVQPLLPWRRLWAPKQWASSPFLESEGGK